MKQLVNMKPLQLDVWKPLSPDSHIPLVHSLFSQDYSRMFNGRLSRGTEAQMREAQDFSEPRFVLRGRVMVDLMCP